MLKNKVLTSKDNNKNKYFIIIFGIILISISFFVDVVFIGLLGLILIISSSFVFEFKGVMASTVLSSVAVLNSAYVSYGQISMQNIVSSVAVYFIIAIGLTKNISIIKKQNEELKHKNNQVDNLKEEFEKVFQGTKDNMFLMRVEDDSFRYIRNNIAHQNSTGITIEEFRGKTPKELLGEALGEEIENKYKMCLEAKDIVTYEEKLTLPSGDKIWKTTLTPIVRDNKVTHIIGSRQDITAKREEEMELIEGRERLRSIIETTQDGFWVIGENQKIVDVNEAYCKMIGYSREEILNLQIFDLEYEETAEETKKHVQEIIQEGSQIFETKHIKKNGEVIDIEISVSCLSRDPVEMICFCRDITSRKQAKKNLIEVKERMKNIIDGANVGTWEWNVQTGKTIFNEKWAEIIGYELKELSPIDIETWQELTHPEDLISAEKQLNKVLNKEKDYYDIELRMRHKNGGWVWINDRGKVTKWSSDGKALIMNGTHIDITDRKEAEEELYQFHNLIQYILKHNTTGVAVHDKDMNYMYVSQRYIERYKIKDKDIIGKNHYEVFPDLPQKWKDAHKRSLKGEVISEDEDIYYREDGSVDWTRWESRPWYDKNGTVGGIVVYTEIINEQKEMEAEIYNEREQFKTTLLSVGDAIISTDKNGVITIMNEVAEDLTKWKKEEAVGKPLEDVLVIINEYTRKPCENPARKALKLKKTVEMENHTLLIAKDGEEIPIEDSAAPIKNRNGKITGVVIVFRDFTEKREKQKQIEYLSFHDHLTGLYNRRYMENSIKNLDSKDSMPLSLIIADVNGLKLTNDAYGHEIGDNLLVKVSEILRSSCRKEDIICRVGGDEFVVILPNTDEESVDKIIEKITEQSQNTSINSAIVSLAIGAATKTACEKDIFELYKEADNRMYKNKIKYGKTMRSKTIEKVLIDVNNKYDHEQIHTERVSQYCANIARAMNLREKEIEDAKIAGALHDIGKIVISPDLLKKQNKLTSEEWDEIKNHPIISYQLLKSVDEYTHLAEAVLYHHERLDGSGYPENLKGNEIPFLSKIISVADAYEAMTARRPYQKTKTKEEAVEELKLFAGTQFDKEIVDVFIHKVL